MKSDYMAIQLIQYGNLKMVQHCTSHQIMMLYGEFNFTNRFSSCILCDDIRYHQWKCIKLDYMFDIALTGCFPHLKKKLVFVA